jgi:hypothetical protein
LKAKRGESLEVEVFIYGSLKNLAVGLRFKIWTKFRGGGGAGHCPARPDIVLLGLSVSGWGFLG